MIIALLRHGIAEEASAATGHRDEPRALTEDGRARMTSAARGIRHLSLPVEVALTSPLTRCVQTAQIVSDLNGWRIRTDERLRPGLDADALFDVLLEYPDHAGVLVCGHQPDLGQIASDLIGGGDLEFKKGALAIIELHAMRPRGGVLRAHYPPATLRRLGAV